MAGGDIWFLQVCVTILQYPYHSPSFSIPLCALLNQHLATLAAKFPATKFLKSISTTCIPNYPDRNLPTIFVYNEGDLKGQIVGGIQFGGMNITVEGMKPIINSAGPPFCLQYLKILGVLV
jgi:hypothetical protein